MLTRDGGRPLCTLCDGPRPNAWHTLLECSALEVSRHLLDKVTRWLRRVFSPLSILRRVCLHDAQYLHVPCLVDCLSEGGEGPLLHRSPGTLASYFLASLGRKPSFPTFVFLPGEWIHHVRKDLDSLRVRTAIVLVVPSNCWPGYVPSPMRGEDTWFLPDNVWLLVWGPTACLHFPDDLDVVKLSHILHPSLSGLGRWASPSTGGVSLGRWTRSTIQTSSIFSMIGGCSRLHHFPDHCSLALPISRPTPGWGFSRRIGPQSLPQSLRRIVRLEGPFGRR
jgi:hypothetical protein